ncbi:MAG: ribosome-binding factor A [Candidatus Babeliaceae bacterium]|nr:ribosome-binding factor A [Candidatus Babeliaceae bacterium]
MKTADRIKRARKASLIRKTVAKLLANQALDDPQLQSLSISRVDFNVDQSICWIFFYSEQGEEHFNEKLEHLKLYKPSLRTAIAKEIPGKYVPEIVFRYDEQLKKQIAIEQLLDTLKDQ